MEVTKSSPPSVQDKKYLKVDVKLIRSSGLSSEVQPLPSERAEPELQQAAGFRREAAVCMLLL